MLTFLKNHPFAVEAHFKKSVVLTFALPKKVLENRISACLALDAFQDTHAFVAVAMVSTKALRPKGFPRFLGNDFYLVGYRVFVRYTNTKGKRLRGLYILKSETNKARMEFFGNVFTHYNYSTTDIFESTEGAITEITSQKSNFDLKFEERETAIALPEKSPFSNWKEARRYAGPLPFTFTYDTGKKEVLIIEGVRKNWKPEPIEVIDFHFSFLETPDFKDAVLANAFIINNIPYYWKKGKVEKWQP